MRKLLLIVTILAFLFGCSVLPDLDQREAEESRLDEAADQLLFVADTPEMRRLRIQALTALLIDIVNFRVANIDDRRVMVAILSPLLERAWTESQFAKEYPNRELFFLRRQILSVAVTLAKDYKEGITISAALDVDRLLLGLETLGLAKEVAKDMRRNVTNMSPAQFSDSVKALAEHNLNELEK